MMNRKTSQSAYITLTLTILLLGAALQRAEGAEAVFLSANNEMHFAWFDNNTVVKGDSTNHFSRRSAPNTNRPGVPYAFGIQAFQGKPMRIGDLVRIPQTTRCISPGSYSACQKAIRSSFCGYARDQAMP